MYSAENPWTERNRGYVQRVMAVCAWILRRMRWVDRGLEPGGRSSLLALARDLAVARRAIERAPEVANPDLARLAREVRSGSYQVPADLVADKIIEQALMTERMGGYSGHPEGGRSGPPEGGHYGWGT
jgi:hypothetical protein